MNEPESRDAAATTRSQSVIHYVDRNIDEAARILAGAVDRAASAARLALVAVVPGPGDGLALSESLSRARGGLPRAIIPISSVARGRRAIASGATAICAAPGELSALLRESLLSLTDLQTLVLVWPEELVRDESLARLEAVLAEVPRSAERIVFCAARSPDLAAFFERVMWRARSVDHVPDLTPADVTVRVVSAGASDRTQALSAVLDAIDPARAEVLVSSDDGEASARASLAALGYAPDDRSMRVVRDHGEGATDLVVYFDHVPGVDSIRQAATRARHVVAVLKPSRVAALRRVATVSPFTWSSTPATARTTWNTVRDELQATVASDAHLPFVPILEPLLDSTDAVELAAAAMALLDRERRKARKAVAPQAPPPAARESRSDRPRPSSSSDPRNRGDRPWPRKPGADPRDNKRGSSGDRERPRREGKSWRDRDDRPPRGDRPRRDDIERMPRAAREGSEWSERGERLRNSRRGPRGGHDR
jgi:hypothetical protein